MKTKLSRTSVFALKGYTIKSAGGRFFIREHCAPLTEWAGPYKTLQHATTAIARKLAREFAEREQRLQQWKDRRHD